MKQTPEQRPLRRGHCTGAPGKVAPYLILAVILLLAPLMMGPACPSGTVHPGSNADVNHFVFRPQAGFGTSYDLRATGQDLQYSDVKHFEPEINVNRGENADGEIRMKIDVFEERSGNDYKLGTMELTLPGSTEQFPFSAATLTYLSAIDGARAPAGAPNQTNGTFWLGCTKRARVRGNAPKSDDDHADVYLKIRTPVAAAPGIEFSCGSFCRTPTHRVRCI